MCSYFSWSCRNPHTVIRRNCCTPWSRRLFSCRPTLISTLSTSCCSCILSAGFFWRSVGEAVSSVFCAIFASLSIFLLLFVFVPLPNCEAVVPVGCGSLSYQWGGGVVVIATWTGRGGGSFVTFFFPFFAPSPSWCWFLAVRGRGRDWDILVAFLLVVWSLRMLLYQLFQPGHPLTEHFCQLSRLLRFPLISRRVCCGEYLQYFADRIRVVAVIVSVFRYNFAVGDADFRSPCLLRRPLYVRQYYNRA